MITQPAVAARNAEGGGWAHSVIVYGPESAPLWVVFMDADGACWTFPNTEVRMSFKWTLGRRKPEDTAEREEHSSAAAQQVQCFRPA